MTKGLIVLFGCMVRLKVRERVCLQNMERKREGNRLVNYGEMKSKELHRVIYDLSSI